MPDTIIENPIINSPFEEPKQFFQFDQNGITNKVIDGRRVSAYFIPIPKAKKRNAQQMAFETEWTLDRLKPNDFINKVRSRVQVWRKGGYQGLTQVSRKLLNYWINPEREHCLFFCQIEALETLIFINEVAGKHGDGWIEETVKKENEAANSELFRIACKMATGSGKTVVMAMIIAWQALNKFANTQDPKFSDTFLIVTPGITIRDRLRVLLPNDPNNYYKIHDLVPPDMMMDLNKISIIITNFHALMLREKIPAGRLTKAILKTNGSNAFTETPDQMVRRVCRELGNKKNIIVINDEAHHCYRRKLEDIEEEKLIGEDRTEAEKRNEEARVWINGLEAVKKKIGVKTVYDLSATPFFLKGSGYPEGTLFGWVVSDFALIDAIESGIVKVPRVPVADNAMLGDQPTYRDLWLRIRDDLPKKGRKTDKLTSEAVLPGPLEGAIKSLYDNYEKTYKLWMDDPEAKFRGQTPPVFIVVCNNTNVSKMVYDYVAGWEKNLKDGSTVLVPGQLKHFSNVDGGLWLDRPNTILIDSQQLESGEGMSDEFKKIAKTQIEEFKNEYRQRFPGRDTSKLTDEDLLREVMNTVGKQGKLGEDIKCVVSVSMLTEGWDATTVTHILGVRAFGTQLLCEQVVGRGLRRMSFATDENGWFSPEYAEVYGVPFSFIPCSGSQKNPQKGKIPTHVRALEERIQSEITFPRVMGYRFELQEERINAHFSTDSQMAMTTADIPTETEVSSMIGETRFDNLYGMKSIRLQSVDFELAKKVLETYFKDDEGGGKPWLFPQLIRICKEWRENYLICKDNTFPQLVLLTEKKDMAAKKIYLAIVAEKHDEKTLKPILRAYDTIGSTRYVEFDTTRSTYPTQPDKCHVSHVVCDTESWEQKMAQALEEMDEVDCYVKNQGLGFTIPYTMDGEEREYIPDFIVKMRPTIASTANSHYEGNEGINLIVEVSGEARRDKAIKIETAKKLWVPAINNLGEFGKWAFIEITDPWDAKNTLRSYYGR